MFELVVDFRVFDCFKNVDVGRIGNNERYRNELADLGSDARRTNYCTDAGKVEFADNGLDVVDAYILEYFDISSCQDVEGVNLSRPDDDDFVLFALH